MAAGDRALSKTSVVTKKVLRLAIGHLRQLVHPGEEPIPGDQDALPDPDGGEALGMAQVIGAHPGDAQEGRHLLHAQREGQLGCMGKGVFHVGFLSVLKWVLFVSASRGGVGLASLIGGSGLSAPAPWPDACVTNIVDSISTFGFQGAGDTVSLTFLLGHFF